MALYEAPRVPSVDFVFLPYFKPFLINIQVKPWVRETPMMISIAPPSS